MASNGQSNSSQKPGMKRHRHRSAEPLRANKKYSSSDHAVTVQAVPTAQTAPRLIQTIKFADHRYRLSNGVNPYLDPPLGYDEQFDARRHHTSFPPTCSHIWTTQKEQTVLPYSDIGDTGGNYRLACVCQNCRWHIDLQITHKANPCPKEGFPLHHFTDFKRDNPEQEWYSAHCSGCSANLRIDYRAPRLQSNQIELLIDVDILRQRFENARKEEPDRGNWRGPAQPIDVLDALATYITDALKSEDEPKRIPKLNRRFMVSLGEECKELLETLEFQNGGDVYYLPQPEKPDPWSWNLRKTLEDVQQELWALMRNDIKRKPGIDVGRLKGFRDDATPFEDDIQLFLSTFEYDKSRTTRRTPNLTLEESSWFAGLGAVADFTDDLLAYSFDRQITTDPANIPYYYDCLAKIAKKKNSEPLEMKIVLLASEGYYGRDDVARAYKYFTLDPRQANELTDEHIRCVFESRLSSVAKSMEVETREKLRMIGLSRGSKALLDAAANEFSDWEAALRWLEPSYNGQALEDSYITSVAAVKLSDNPDDPFVADKINKAIKLIAEHRNSAALHAWLTGNEIPGDEDELAAAYRFYNIQDRSAEIDKQMLELSFELIKKEEEEKPDGESKAPLAEKYYNLLMAVKPAPKPKPPANYNLPVGLENNGNTCYLNALLQYLFAIAPFRETATRLDEFQQPLDDTAANYGKVGGEPVTRQRVEDGQQLMRGLGNLFEQMQTTANASVTPTLELAAEALKAPPGSGTTAVTSHHKRPSLAFDKSQLNKLKGDETKPDENAIVDSPTIKGDDASDITLVGDVIMTPESDVNEEQAGSAGKNEGTTITIESKRDSMDVDDGSNGPPSRPPPVPPRPAQSGPKPQLQEQINEVVRQQDAHEVSSRMVQRALAAIIPKTIDEDGERSDTIRDLFYGIYQQIDTNDTPAHVDFPLSYDVSVFLQMINKPKDIPEALDYYFGREQLNMMIEETQKNEDVELYSVIKKAPPFLQLYLQNRSWDQENKRMRRISHNVELNETIYLDRFMEKNNAEILPLREQAWDIRDRLDELKQQKANYEVKPDLPSHDAYDSLSDFIDIVDEEEDDDGKMLKAILKAQAERDRSEVQCIDKEMVELQKCSEEISYEKYNTQEHRYRIMAIFMHRGDGSFGHWWIHIRDFKNNVWREFNDQRVTERKDISDLLKARNGEEDANYVIYVRDDLKDELVDPLSRKKPEEDLQVANESEFTEVEDVEMISMT